MFEKTDIKLDVITIYLEKRIPDCKIEDLYQDDEMHVFQLNCKGRPVTVNISRAFIDEHSPAEILTTIKRHRLESYFRDITVGNIVITHNGIASDL